MYLHIIIYINMIVKMEMGKVEDTTRVRFRRSKPQRFVIFALVGEREVDVRLRARRAFRPLIAQVIVHMVSEGSVRNPSGALSMATVQGSAKDAVCSS